MWLMYFSVTSNRIPSAAHEDTRVRQIQILKDKIRTRKSGNSTDDQHTRH